MPIYTPWRGWSAVGGPVASVSGTSADQTLISLTIPGNTLVNVGETIAFSWRGQLIQNVDNNQTITGAVQILGADVVRRASPIFNSSATAKLVQLKGEIQKMGTTSLMAFLELQLMASDQSLTGSDVGIGSLLSPTFTMRAVSSVAAGITVNWSADITFALLMAMMTSSASFSFQGFGWHAEKLSI